MATALTLYANGGHFTKSGSTYQANGDCSYNSDLTEAYLSDNYGAGPATAGDVAKAGYKFLGYATSPTATKADSQYWTGLGEDMFNWGGITKLYAVFELVEIPTGPTNIFNL